jgi:hypothetical protein
MRRIDYIRNMSVEELAKAIIDHSITDEFCDSSCGCEDDCPHDVECCVIWLSGEMRGDTQ